MTRPRFAYSLVLVLLIPSSSSAGMISYDWDDGTLQGWTKYTPFGGTLTNPGTGGNPDGYLLVRDTVATGGGLFARAPSAVSGDLSIYSGVQWDEFVFNNGADTRVPTAIFIVGGPTTTTYRLSPNPLNVVGQWSTRFVEFEASNFSLSGVLGTSGTDSFDTVIRDVDIFLVSMDTSTRAGGAFESGIDNFTLLTVPEPSSIALCSLMSFVIAAFGFRRMQTKEFTQVASS